MLNYAFAIGEVHHVRAHRQIANVVSEAAHRTEQIMLRAETFYRFASINK